MELKDVASNFLALIALGLSIYATITAQKNSFDERKRTIRAQLTDVLAKLMGLSIDGAKLYHEAQGDPIYLDAINSALGQQNGFLLDQADFLSEEIPALVTTYELNTIAIASANAGDMIRAEKYNKRAIAVAPRGLYKAQATRSYGVFLFRQGRAKEARERFGEAIDLLKGEGDLVQWQRGVTYQWWALNELQFARSPDRAQEYFERARKEYSAIDVEFIRNEAIASLERVTRSPQSAGTIPPSAFQQGAPQPR